MKYDAVSIIKSILLFVLAGVCEIGGGWLVWQWRKSNWHWGAFVAGSLILVAYGVVATLQEDGFGRTYAVYGGFFIVLSLFWGWAFDGMKPDLFDFIGSAIALGGVCVMMFVPRTDEGAESAPLAAPAPAPSFSVTG